MLGARGPARGLGGSGLLLCEGPDLGFPGWRHLCHLAQAWAGSPGRGAGVVVVEGRLLEGRQEEGAGGSKEKAKAHSSSHMGPKCTYFWCSVWLHSGPQATVMPRECRKH